MTLGLGLSLPNQRSSGSGGAAVPAANDILSVEILGTGSLDVANLNYVDGNGWVAKVTLKGMAAGGTVDGSKLTISRTVTGYDSAKALQARTRTTTGSKVVRKPVPNPTASMIVTSGSDCVVYCALNERVYSADSIAVTVASGFYTQGGNVSRASAAFTTATNNSAFAYEQPQSKPVNFCWDKVAGTITAGVAVTNHWYEAGRTAAAVEFIFTDGTHTVTSTVTSMKDSSARLSTSQGMYSPVFEATSVDISALTDGICSWSWKIYGWRGQTIWDSETFGIGPSGATLRSTPSTRQWYDTPKSVPFVKDAAGTTYPDKYVYVSKSAAANAGGTASTTWATALANPARSIDRALATLLTGGGNFRFIIRLGPGDWVGMQDGQTASTVPSAQARQTLPVIIEKDPALLNSDVRMVSDGTGTRRLPLRNRVQNLTVYASPGTSNGSIFEGNDSAGNWSPSGPNYESQFDNVDWGTASTPNISSTKLVTNIGRIQMRNCRAVDAGNFIPGNRGIFQMLAFNTGSGITKFNGHFTIGCRVTGDNSAPAVPGTPTGETGFMCGMHVFNAYLGYLNAPWVINAVYSGGVGIMGNVMEPIGGASAKGMAIFGDGLTLACDNVVVAFNTVPGEAFNFLYAEYSATARVAVLANWITTVGLSTTVTCTKSAHGRANGDYVWITNAIAVGGITISGQYQISNVTANTFDITHSVAAASGATGGTTAGALNWIGEAASYVRKTGTFSANCVSDHNTKKDTYTGNNWTYDFRRVGNWDVAHWVDFKNNDVSAGSDSGGQNSLMGEVDGSLAPALFNSRYQGGTRSFSNDQGHNATDVGGGTYVPTGSSSAKSMIPVASGSWGHQQAFPIDLYGATRLTNGTGAAGAVEQ